MLENVAVMIVQWEAKEVLSQMNCSMSKRSLPAKVLPRALVESGTSPSFLSEIFSVTPECYFTA